MSTKIVESGSWKFRFDENEIRLKEISFGQDQRFFMICLNDKNKFQVRATNKELLDKNLEHFSIQQEDRDKIIALFNHDKMNEIEIKEKCIEIRPYMKKVFETWSESSMSNFTLTSVGIAIGHANIKRLVGEFADLTIWIN